MAARAAHVEYLAETGELSWAAITATRPDDGPARVRAA